MLLVFPPAAKPSEPPAGVARIAGALGSRQIPCTVLDANLEGLLFLLANRRPGADTWTRRAVRSLPSHLQALRDPATYRFRGRYDRAVRDIQRVLAMATRPSGAVVGLADYDQPPWSPLRSADLLAAAAAPEQNPYYPWFSTRLPAALDQACSSRARPVIGFSLNYLSQAICTFAMIGFIRKARPGAMIVLGGGLVTSWMKGPRWHDPFGGLVDRLVSGPGEGPLLELFGSRDNGPCAAVPDYRSFPRADYLSPGFILPYSASTGCYWNKCSFCPEPAEGNPYLPVPVSRAMDELGQLTESTRPALIHLLDNAVSPALMAAIASRPFGVPWYGFVRFGSELRDPGFCRLLRQSGCVMLKLGLESGDQSVLDRLGKGIDLATASLVLENLRQAGIAAYVYLLFGTPPETAVEARRTLAFVEDHRKAITFLNLAIFNMPLGAADAATWGSGPFYDGDLSLYTSFLHPAGWDRKQVRQFLDTEFKRSPAVAAILRNDPTVFTSNHAALFCSKADGPLDR